MGDGYHSLRGIDYRGDAEAIDVDGSKAAEHMALADALRTVEKTLARANLDRKHGPLVSLGLKEYEAVSLLVKTLRAKGSSDA